jgi:DNA-binding MarR family transcriptional regulator
MSVKKSIPSSERIELERFLPYRLNVVAEAVSRSLSRIYAKQYGISVPEWRVIATLGQYTRMTAKEIGAHSRMHKTKVSRAAAQLAARGLLSRQPNDQDKREAYLTLTENGEAVYREIVPHALAFAESIFEGVSGEERALLEELLARLERRARDLSAQN